MANPNLNPHPGSGSSTSNSEVSMLRSPPYFPALWSESTWWIGSRYVQGWKAQLTTTQLEALTDCESNLASLDDLVAKVKNRRSHYKRYQLQKFFLHEQLVNSLNELERILEILQGVKIACFCNPRIWNDLKSTRRWYAETMNGFFELQRALPRDIPVEARMITKMLAEPRENAIYCVRQLLKHFQRVRFDIGGSTKEVLMEEERMKEVISQEIEHLLRSQTRYVWLT